MFQQAVRVAVGRTHVKDVISNSDFRIDKFPRKKIFLF